QEHGIKPGREVVDHATGKSPGQVHALNDAEGWIELARAPKAAEAPHPTTLLPDARVIRTTELRKSLVRIGEHVVDRGLSSSGDNALARALLLKEPPSFGKEAGGAISLPGEDAVTAARRLAPHLADRVLPIQGPPGSGKTYVGAQMIVELLRLGKRVG